MWNIPEHPGRLYVIATLLPIASFVILLLIGGLRNAARPYRGSSVGATLYWLFGGDQPLRMGAWIATGAIALSFILSATGLVWFLKDFGVGHHEETLAAVVETETKAGAHDHGHEHAATHHHAWAEHVTWARVGMLRDDSRPAIELNLGYYIDHLAAVMFTMVTFVAMLIHLFSAGYMSEEMHETVEDHQVHTEDGHLKRKGRYSRFFMYLSLFCFSMLNLVIADNLFQVFISWELVGICSYLLIGFYYERQSASNAANKAFITNRVGDAGFIVGLMVIWSFIGTFSFQEIFQRVRAPQVDSHGVALPANTANSLVRGEMQDEKGRQVFHPDAAGSQVLLFPPHVDAPDLKEGPEPGNTTDDWGVMPYILLTIAGLGIFTGCVGKSAQFPLQVWLPDAMEGPTPVSALIHAATMVAAGVYLVGRVFPLFTPEARLVIAYVGAITLFVAATIAIVMNDIKKVLAYSTVSQLGYMMLALGVGGWVAGLLHLLTHAFFKALLFLGSGSVIYGCHHEQDMRRMGGLLKKMPITGYTMLVGVLAIAGTPLFSGWYSKDAIIAQALGFASVNKQHLLLLILPLVTAGITCFYMFRMWFLTFLGEPKDEHVYEHARESPWLMTIPLILLAACSFSVAWGAPPWNAEASFLGKLLHSSQPAAVAADFKPVEGLLEDSDGWVHPTAGLLAMLAAVMGALIAALVYYYRMFDPAETSEQFGFLYRLFDRKWYFDELYSSALVRPALVVSHWARNFDARVIDWIIDNTARMIVWISKLDGKIDNGIVDGLVNVTANAIHSIGNRLRRVQTGYIRNYILFLVLAAIGIFALLSYFWSLASAQN
ncbi:MAG TPA: NADH-quinone oxidoreductase subunit L, partial [Gemmataceae bacterium]|jgi:NADH-quinone oxidoreductase subunit L|nr:NADH-quinone oxidoreductase subunit L [Gemmataceae bacterium]